MKSVLAGKQLFFGLAASICLPQVKTQTTKPQAVLTSPTPCSTLCNTREVAVMPILQARISEEEAKAIKTYAKTNGLTTSQVVRESVASYITKPPEPLYFGCMKGKMWIADDFDEIPEGFEEYI